VLAARLSAPDKAGCELFWIVVMTFRVTSRVVHKLFIRKNNTHRNHLVPLAARKAYAKPIVR